jgi:diguanylate cyclase (GGDEF)-like protein
LTGLGNHRRLSDKIDRLISDRAGDPAPFTVGILDLGGFKPINDLFGRKAGDAILVQVAMRLRAAMDARPSRASARMSSHSCIRWCSPRKPPPSARSC